MVNNCQAANFGSYEKIYFDVVNQGVTLISGANGTGKSTLCDLIPWCLFGKTAKQLSVNEVVGWGSPDPTTSSISISIMGKEYTIFRSRGLSSKNNDLYVMHNDEIIRGKDINDTQQIINNIIGLNYDAYVTSSYYHEFSKPAAFFVLGAKQRREVLEELSDLRFVDKLQHLLITEKKSVSKNKLLTNEKLSSAQVKLTATTGHLTSLKSSEKSWAASVLVRIQDLATRTKEFEKTRKATLKDLEIKSIEFENKRSEEIYNLEKRILDLESVAEGIRLDICSKEKDLAAETDNCQHCGAPKDYANKKSISTAIRSQHGRLSSIEADVIRLKSSVDKAKDRINNFTEELANVTKECPPSKEDLDKIKKQANPFTESVLSTSNACLSLDKEIEDLHNSIKALSYREFELDVLTAMVVNVRSTKLESAILSLQNRANNMLEEYFDSEFRVMFVLDEDKIDVTIVRDGNTCSYAQLSKGQRQILKLCFSTSVMKHVSNIRSVRLPMFFDESMDGMDDDKKLQALKLFNNLSDTSSSVFVVDHNYDLKTRFLNNIKVRLVHGKSEIEKT